MGLWSDMGMMGRRVLCGRLHRHRYLCSGCWELTFQNGSMPVGSASLKTLVTLSVSTMRKAMERHIEASITPNRGLTTTSSQRPKLYSFLMV